MRALNNHHCTHLKRLIDEFEGLIDEIEGSWSYKLSRALTAPMRWLKTGR